MRRMRDLIKRAAPSGLRDGVRAVRRLAAGPAIEESVLRPYRCAADVGDRGRLRLNLVLPSISAREAFGGVTTGLDYFLQLGRALGAPGATDLRVIVEKVPARDDDALAQAAARWDIERTAIETHGLLAANFATPTRRNDVFMTFNWWTTVNLMPLLEAQAARDGGPLRPRIYLMQDYEPHFYPFSSAHMLARHAYDGGGPVLAVVNSMELNDFLVAQGHRFADSFVFEPKMNPRMRPFADRAATAERRREILIYGRPQVPRNCFSIVRMGLEKWAAEDPSARRWRLLSVGLEHRPVALPGGARIESLGKLPLEDYAERLLGAAVGLSLMASPHPSYPPLEMAHFGLRTLTNGYANKDMTRRHPNIASLATCHPDTVAAALSRLCADFEADPARGPSRAAGDGRFLSQGPFEEIDRLAATIRALSR